MARGCEKCFSTPSLTTRAVKKLHLYRYQLTPAEITNIREELAQTIGDPVIIRTTSISDTQVALTGFDQRRQLENLLIGKMVEQGAEVIYMAVEEIRGGFTISAIVMAFEDDAPPDETIAGIQADLTATMEVPVTIQSKIIAARQVNSIPPDQATPAPEP